jgi:Lipase (class 3)
MSKKRVNLWTVFFFIAVCLLVIVVVVAVVDLNSYNQQTYRVSRAIENINECPSFNSGMCQLTLDSNLATPVFSSTYDTSAALFAANLVAAVEYPSINDQPQELIPVFTTQIEIRRTLVFNNNIIGVVWKSTSDPGLLYVSFRGTRTRTEWDKDLMFQQVSYPHTTFFPMTRRYFSNTSTPYTSVLHRSLQANCTFFEGEVHEGFLDVYNCIRQQILDIMDNSVNVVVASGHSLGAALATLLVSDKDLHMGATFYCYTFGGPKVGNEEFANFVQNQCSYFRIANEDDIICNLPPSVSPNFVGQPDDVFLYTHVKTDPIRFQDNRGALLYNHAMQTYLTFLRSS